MQELKNKFKSFFTYDYMNYINMDINKRKISISETQSEFRGKPIILEGYLLFIFNGTIFNSYMLDKLKIINTNLTKKSNNSKKYQTSNNHDSHDSHNSHDSHIKKEYYFPESLPDGFPNSYTKSIHSIMEIINQVFTIMKYISIIVSYSGINKPFNVENTFEIIKVQFKLYNDNSIILEKCIIKKDWVDNENEENKLLTEWLDALIFRTVLGGKIALDLELASTSLFKLDYTKKKISIQNYLKADNLNRKDFNNTFIIIASDFIFKKSSVIKYNYLIKILNKYGLKQDEFYSIGKKPAFIWFGFDEEPLNYQLTIQHYNTLSYTSNYLGKLDIINEKEQLYNSFKKQFPDEYLAFLPASFILKKDTQYKTGNIYIARPVNEINIKTNKKTKTSSSDGILYIYDENSMNKAKENLGKYDIILISEYIRNPLLIKGKKFHLRMAFLITYFNSELKTYLLDDALFRVAKLPFVLDNFDNMDIHDTHYFKSDAYYYFPQDFNTDNIGKTITQNIINTLLKDIREIMRKVSVILGNSMPEKYPNIKKPFQMEGIDIMITEDFKPILIECNGRAGFSNDDDENDIFYNKVFDLIDRNALEILFGNSGKKNTDEPLFVKKI